MPRNDFDLEEAIRIFDKVMSAGMRQMRAESQKLKQKFSNSNYIRLPPSSVFFTEEEVRATRLLYR